MWSQNPKNDVEPPPQPSSTLAFQAPKFRHPQPGQPPSSNGCFAISVRWEHQNSSLGMEVRQGEMVELGKWGPVFLRGGWITLVSNQPDFFCKLLGGVPKHDLSKGIFRRKNSRKPPKTTENHHHLGVTSRDRQNFSPFSLASTKGANCWIFTASRSVYVPKKNTWKKGATPHVYHGPEN